MPDGSDFSTSVSTLAIVHVFHYSHSSGWEVILFVVLVCIFLKIRDIEYLLCAFGYLYRVRQYGLLECG